MTPLNRAIRIYLDSNKLGLDVTEVRKFLILKTGEKPGEKWLSRVQRFAANERKALEKQP